MAGKSLHLGLLAGDPQRTEILKALASEPRLAILEYLGPRTVAVTQIAKDLGLPLSTAATHVGVLERCGLLRTDITPASRGLQKVCARTYDEVVLSIPRNEGSLDSRVEISTPLGAFSDFEVEPTCGLASATGLIGYTDDPATFWEPDRIKAQLLWFRAGFVEYRFPYRVPGAGQITAVQFAAEICSEAPLHDNDWPSDISLWINGVHLGVWTCPGDFGGERGRLTPDWWDTGDSQYGLLKRWRVTEAGTTLDGMHLSDVTLADLRIARGDAIRIRVGVLRDSEHMGGVNLFGAMFGNYPQDLILSVMYKPHSKAPSGHHVGADSDGGSVDG